LSMKKPVCGDKTFRTADLKTQKRPLWEDVDDKMSYLSRFKETDAKTEKVIYRVFAYARTPMKFCEWRELFDAFEVKKINGQFEDYQSFTSRLNENPGQMVARHTIKQMVDRIKQLEDEARVADADNEKSQRRIKKIMGRSKKMRKRIKQLEDESLLAEKKQDACLYGLYQCAPCSP
jgi:transcriptional regulator with GAF, ATPase, and Fis domain